MTNRMLMHGPPVTPSATGTADSTSSYGDDEFAGVFALLDAKSCGTIRLEQIFEFVSACPNPPAFDAVTRLYAEFDEDGSGDIDSGEFVGFCDELERVTGYTAKDLVRFFERRQYERLFDLVDMEGVGTVHHRVLRHIMETVGPMLNLRSTSAELGVLIREVGEGADVDDIDVDCFSRLLERLTRGNSIVKVVQSFEAAQRRTKEIMDVARQRFEHGPAAASKRRGRSGGVSPAAGISDDDSDGAPPPRGRSSTKSPADAPKTVPPPASLSPSAGAGGGGRRSRRLSIAGPGMSSPRLSATMPSSSSAGANLTLPNLADVGDQRSTHNDSPGTPVSVQLRLPCEECAAKDAQLRLRDAEIAVLRTRVAELEYEADSRRARDIVNVEPRVRLGLESVELAFDVKAIVPDIKQYALESAASDRLRRVAESAAQLVATTSGQRELAGQVATLCGDAHKATKQLAATLQSAAAAAVAVIDGQLAVLAELDEVSGGQGGGGGPQPIDDNDDDTEDRRRRRGTIAHSAVEDTRSRKMSVAAFVEPLRFCADECIRVRDAVVDRAAMLSPYTTDPGGIMGAIADAEPLTRRIRLAAALVAWYGSSHPSQCELGLEQLVQEAPAEVASPTISASFHIPAGVSVAQFLTAQSSGATASPPPPLGGGGGGSGSCDGGGDQQKTAAAISTSGGGGGGLIPSLRTQEARASMRRQLSNDRDVLHDTGVSLLLQCLRDSLYAVQSGSADLRCARRRDRGVMTTASDEATTAGMAAVFAARRRTRHGSGGAVDGVSAETALGGGYPQGSSPTNPTTGAGATSSMLRSQPPRVRNIYVERDTRTQAVEALLKAYLASGTLVPDNFQRVYTDCVTDQRHWYLFGSKRIELLVVEESLAVKVGGGYLYFDEYCDRFTHQEVSRVNRTASRSPVHTTMATPSSSSPPPIAARSTTAPRSVSPQVVTATTTMVAPSRDAAAAMAAAEQRSGSTATQVPAMLFSSRGTKQPRAAAAAAPRSFAVSSSSSSPTGAAMRTTTGAKASPARAVSPTARGASPSPATTGGPGGAYRGSSPRPAPLSLGSRARSINFI